MKEKIESISKYVLIALGSILGSALGGKVGKVVVKSVIDFCDDIISSK